METKVETTHDSSDDLSPLTSHAKPSRIEHLSTAALNIATLKKYATRPPRKVRLVRARHDAHSRLCHLQRGGNGATLNADSTRTCSGPLHSALRPPVSGFTQGALTTQASPSGCSARKLHPYVDRLGFGKLSGVVTARDRRCNICLRRRNVISIPFSKGDPI